MAELLVMAVSHAHADPEKDRRGAYKKGDIVVVAEDGHTWGAREGLPTFIVVRCPTVTVAQVRDRMASWVPDIRFTVLQSDTSLDLHRIRMRNANAGTSGAANITRTQVQRFLDDWAATFVSVANGALTFDVRVENAALSVGMWRRPLDAFPITHTAYDPTGGVASHTFVADLTAHPRYVDAETRAKFVQAVEREIAGVGGVVVSSVGGLVGFNITRDAVRERMRAYVQDRLGTFRRRRFHFTAAQVDTVIAAGGSITVTAAQLASAVRDRVSE